MPLIFGRVSRTTYRTAALNDTACVDIDECAVNNGHCDMLVGCTNTPGGREWGACPHGFVGSSELSTFDSGCQFSQPGLNSSTALVIPSVTLTLDNVQATMFSGPEHELVAFTGSLVDDLDAAMPLIFGAMRHVKPCETQCVM